MNNVGEVENCAGCYACANVCPKECIIYRQDEKGFSYPIIDYNKCINCGRCLKACAQVKDVQKSLPKISYALKHKSAQVRFNSTSGGAFTVISDYILDSQGLVYGATMKENYNVEHIVVHNKSQRDLLRKSKYLQSDLSNIYKDVLEKLKSGKKVLFTGTPCQVAGLKTFLNKDYDNLFTCDVICHGVPSKDVFKQYIKLKENENKQQVESLDFRTKKFGQKAAINIKFNEKEYVRIFETDEFGVLFTGGYIMRDSCYNCKYATKERVSDITIGDFWGIDKIVPDFDDNKGVSMVLINTDKGKLIFKSIKEKIDFLEIPLQQCVELQEQLQFPIKKAKVYDEFWKEYNNNKEKSINKYSNKIILKNRVISIAKKTGLLKVYLKIKNN